MSSQQLQFLSLQKLPARLNAKEAAWLLGFSPHEIPILMSGGLLKPLGHPPANGPKYFSATIIEEYRRDEKWLARTSDRIVQFWRTRNARKSGNIENQQGLD
jgi:hypothetical protein